MSGRKGRRGFGRIRKLPSGRWQASYVAPDLRRTNAPITFLSQGRCRGLARRRAAEDRLGEFERHEPPAPRTAVVTFTDYATAWVETRELKPKTREGYEHVLNKYLVPRFTTRPIADITPADVRTWWAVDEP